MKVQRIFESKIYRAVFDSLTTDERLDANWGWDRKNTKRWPLEVQSKMDNWLFVSERLKFLRQNLARAAGRPKPQEITVKLDDVYAVGAQQNWRDPFTGEELEFQRGGDWGMKNAFGTGASNPLSCSIDRIDSSKGYIPDNIQLVTARTNVAKGNMNNHEFIEYCKKVAQNHQ